MLRFKTYEDKTYEEMNAQQILSATSVAFPARNATICPRRSAMAAATTRVAISDTPPLIAASAASVVT
jgi:hypothetical protein